MLDTTLNALRKARTALPLIRGLLEEEKRQPWLRALKDTERAGAPLPAELTNVDRDLLATLSSAHASRIPGII